MRDVLRLEPWAAQTDVARLLLTPPYRVLVKSGHKTGKSFLTAALVSWFYDCFDPGLVLTTAPTHAHVCDVLWRELRIQRRNAGLGGFSGQEKPEMKSAPDHFAKGLTAAKGEAYQGRHQEFMFFAMDEAVGIDARFWHNTESMFKPDGKHFWLCLFNPTDASSQARQEEDTLDVHGGPAWHVVRMDATEHPNVTAELNNLPQPLPAAVSLSQVNSWVSRWCDPLPAGEAEPQDLFWPPACPRYPAGGSWWRQGPLFEAKCRGMWPSQGVTSVWSDAAWALAARKPPEGWKPLPGDLPVIGCDLGFMGDDDTAIHVRWGPVSVHHERHNGWAEDRTAGRLKQLCRLWAEKATRARPAGSPPVDPTKIPVRYDADGRGGALGTHKGEYRFVPVSAAAAALLSSDHPNRRSELWFSTVALAKRGGVHLGGLPRADVARLAKEATAPRWKLNSAGQMAVERKQETKGRLGHSPDNMDALNLSYCGVREWEAPTTAADPGRDVREQEPAITFGGTGGVTSGAASRLFGGR